MKGSLFALLVICLGMSFVSALSPFDVCRISANNSYTPDRNISELDVQLIQVALNLEYLEAEFFLWSSVGHGLDLSRPDLVAGGPSPIGGQRSYLDDFTRNLTYEFGLQEVGHIRSIRDTLGSNAFPRPLIDISREAWATLFDRIVGVRLIPPFNVYANNINFLLACYVIPYVGLTGYVGANPSLQTPTARRLVAGLLGVESGQDAVIRAYLAQHADSRVAPYTFTVADLTARISVFRNLLDHAYGVDDEGLLVPTCLGAEEYTNMNTLVGDRYSLSYARTPAQVLSVVYGTGNPSCPGGFFPRGGDGEIASNYLAEDCPRYK